MTFLRLASLGIALGALATMGCPHDSPRSDAGPEPDAYVQGSCGSIEGLDDPPVFVGSCIGPADSNGDRACEEFITKPDAPFVGTDCMREGCLAASGNAWSSDPCGPAYVQCSRITGDDGLVWTFYSTNPLGCGS